MSVSDQTECALLKNIHSSSTIQLVILVGCFVIGIFQIGCKHSAKLPPPTEAISMDQRANSDLKEAIKELEKRYALGLYLKDGTKIGWMTIEWKLGAVNGIDAMILSAETSAPQLGLHQIRSIALEASDPGLLFHATIKITHKEDVTAVTVNRRDNALSIVSNVNGIQHEITKPISKDTLFQELNFLRWLNGKRQRGDQFLKYDWSVDKLIDGATDLDKQTTIIFHEKKRILLRGDLTDCYVIKFDSDDDSVTHLLSDGSKFQIFDGLLEYRLEEEHIAKTLTSPIANLSKAFAIKSNKHLGPSYKVKRLVLKLKSSGPFSLPSSHQQQILETYSDGYMIETTTGAMFGEPAPLSERERDDYTKPTLYIQSNNPQIADLAKRIAADRVEPLKIIDALNYWVNIRIEYTSDDDSNNALSVLQRRSGDCTEHTLLLIALARSIGIPTREAGGVVYDTEENAFVWHAWAEFYNGERWISVDPTFNQIPIGATHIKLDGEEISGSRSLAGDLQIDILEFDLKSSDEESSDFFDFFKKIFVDYNGVRDQD